MTINIHLRCYWKNRHSSNFFFRRNGKEAGRAAKKRPVELDPSR